MDSILALCWFASSMHCPLASYSERLIQISSDPEAASTGPSRC